jgi:branched-chain amino acid aminotransferase
MANPTETKKGEKIWFNGKFVEWADAKVHLMTHSLHYGLGVFEGIRCYKTTDGRSAIFRLREHVRRFYDSAKICLMEIPYSQEQLVEACLESVRVNKMDQCYLRPIAFMGDGQMGLGAINPIHVGIAVWDWGAYLGEEGLKNGIRAKVSSFTRMHVNSAMVKGKITGQYVNSILAKREALLAGYNEAILLDAQGYVAEASGENVFCVRDNIIRTPPAASSPILAGITRDALVRIALDKGYKLHERTFTRDWLYVSDEIFFCGTAAEVTPVRELDDRKIGAGKPGPVTLALQQTFFKAVRGEEPKYKEWLTYV